MENAMPAVDTAVNASYPAITFTNGAGFDGTPTAPTTAPVIPVVPYAKPFLDISKIEVFNGDNFKRWQKRIFSVLDMHGVAFALTDAKPDASSTKQLELWVHANKVCRHTIISTLSNDLFDVYCSYKESKEIWDSMILKYTAEDAGK